MINIMLDILLKHDSNLEFIYIFYFRHNLFQYFKDHKEIKFMLRFLFFCFFIQAWKSALPVKKIICAYPAKACDRRQEKSQSNSNWVFYQNELSMLDRLTRTWSLNQFY